jgi:hypothetical protein
LIFLQFQQGLLTIAPSGTDWPIGPPTATTFGFANDLCGGINIMLHAQAAQSKEIGGAITKNGEFIIFPTAKNGVHKVDFSFPYTAPDGSIVINYVQGNPDPADPKNDGKYNNNDIT